MQKYVNFVGKRFMKRLAKDQNPRKVRTSCHYTGKCRGPVHNICNLRFLALNEIHVVFLQELEGQFEYLGENTKKL